MSITDETLRLAAKVRARIDKTVDAETRALTAAWVRAYNQLLPELEQAVDAVIAAGTDGRYPSRAQIARVTRARTALQLAARTLDELAAEARVRLVSAAGKAVDLAVAAEPALILSQMPPRAYPGPGVFDRIDPKAVDVIVARSTKQITALTRPLSREAANVMRQELVRAVPLGTNPRRAAARIVQRLGDGFNGGLTRALVIARTEILDASRAGAAAQQQANADVLTGWVWLAQLDTRTCPSCWSQHGREHPLREAGPLDHQQGRCARMPKAKTWADLGFDLDEPASVVPDAEQVFAGLSQADKLAVMGTSRLEALQSGRAGWDDLSRRRSTTGWRDSYAPTPARALA